MVINDLLPHPLCNINQPSHSEIQLFQNPWSRSCVWSKVKVTFDLQISKVKIMVKVKPIGHIWGLEFNRYVCFLFRGNQTTFGWDIGNSIFDLENSRPRSNLTVTFEALEFNRCVWFSFRGNRTIFGWDIANSIFDLENHIWPWKLKVKVMTKVKADGHIWALEFNRYVWFSFRGNLWLRYSKFQIWPWKLKVKVMAKVKADGHIWALEFNRYVCFSFRGNRTIFGWDIANSIFDLEKSRSRSRRKSNQLIYRSGPTIVPKMKEIQKVVQKLSRGQEAAAGGGGVRTGTKT